ncbi:hypothetical protein CMV_018755 [Castanea mollissima]|uniref:Uncharacterized protein n=1 Tax=Castanea mollissima TaxID=60419 RepID=A0A8J4VHE1_9ROSI|nr:hypothetical protein CMV_018755 [Castanea mollissima]
MLIKVTVVLVLFFMCMPSMEARTKIFRQGEAPPNVPNNIPATTGGDITSSILFTKEALFVTNPPPKDASTLLRRKLRDSPVSSSANPPTYIPPSKNHHASPSQGSKQKSTPSSSSMTMPKGSTSIP